MDFGSHQIVIFEIILTKFDLLFSLKKYNSYLNNCEIKMISIAT